jgi:membrane protein required for beta-lactamase induction
LDSPPEPPGKGLSNKDRLRSLHAHLWEKLQMLFAGALTRPIDIFDLFLHGAPVVLLGWKLLRLARRGGAKSAG